MLGQKNQSGLESPKSMQEEEKNWDKQELDGPFHNVKLRLGIYKDPVCVWFHW